MMEQRGVEPDNLTMSIVLRAAEQAGAAEWAWGLIEVRGVAARRQGVRWDLML